jgi:hypothetical protein
LVVKIAVMHRELTDADMPMLLAIVQRGTRCQGLSLRKFKERMIPEGTTVMLLARKQGSGIRGLALTAIATSSHRRHPLRAGRRMVITLRRAVSSIVVWSCVHSITLASLMVPTPPAA